MGQSNSVFDSSELDDYQELTYFTKKEILHVFQRFCELEKEKNLDEKTLKTAVIARDKILDLPELKVNPFRERIYQVFSSNVNGMTFEDFLDMMSVFSDNAPRNVKVEYAFRIYDFDEDDMISEKDLEQVIKSLIGTEQTLDDDDMNHLIENVFNEADLDDDRNLSFAEFEHVISKAPDFVNSFRIRL